MANLCMSSHRNWHERLVEELDGVRSDVENQFKYKRYKGYTVSALTCCSA
jgi:hypothetical protein